MNIIKELDNLSTIAISGHIRPDGDCIGSVMAMYLFLRKIKPDATIIPMIEKPAEEFNIISGIESIVSDFNPGIDVFDAFIGLDCSTTDRYGEAEKYYESAKKKIVIDHHVTNDGFGDVSLVVPDASSTCEVLFDVIGEENIDIEIAKALYIGVIHDTGILQYSNTKPKTMNIAAKLISYGFDFTEIIENTFYEKTRIQNEILGRCLLESILFMDGKCIAAKVDQKMMNFYGATSHDFEGIVNQLRYTKGVEVAIFMYEIENETYKVSMRSKGTVDVAKIAKFYNGGGHVRAAGFTMSGSFYDIVNNISDSIAIQLGID
ncbi:MAG: bifunctional oligoribonuclease/PAP phosphatase NrnA [Lachnospiraceae bacterium]|nr:bifunctional oligoribonuclease/PAP phosphatase NrnA [Lachnospiraceae bacterium]